MPPLPLAAQDSLLFALRESTSAGKLVLLALFVGSIFSWSVMVTKLRVLRHARLQTGRFLDEFRAAADRQPLRIFENGPRFDGSPLFEVYEAGCEELLFHLLGSTEVDETFTSRLELAGRIAPAQLRAVGSAMERAVGECGLALESQMVLLSTAVAGAPFLGLLGTVWGVMDTFAGVAAAGKPDLAAMAPGVSGALVTTVFSLLVAIPAMFGYNFLLTSLRALIVRTENFAAELLSEFEHRHVTHGPNLGERLAAFKGLGPIHPMRRFSQRQPLTALAEINVTPLLDLCFVLLVIFMITAPLLENSQELTVPTSAITGTPVEPGKVNVLSINREAEVKLDGEPVTPEELDARLRALKVERADALAVVIRAHRELPVQRFIALMDALKRADIRKVGVVTQTPAEEAAGR